MYRLLLVSLLLTACGNPSPSNAGPDAPAHSHDGAPTDDAMPAQHVGGWRMRGGDAARSFEGAAGPGATATSTLFAQNPSTVEFASVGTPVVDEAGNLYHVWYTPMLPIDVVSLDPSGHERWRTTVDAGWSVFELSLGADGNVYGVATMGSGDTMQAKIVGYRASDGAALPGSDVIPGLATLVMPPSGGIYALTYTTAAGYATLAFDAIGGQPRWTMPQGGDGFAISPAGDALAMMAIGPGTPEPAPELVVVDPADAHVLWHHAFADGLGSPTLAFDSDGTIYAAVSKNGSDLHVLRFAPGGQLVYDRDISTLTWPSRMLVGHDAIVVAAQNGQTFAGIGLQKSDGMPPADSQLSCGEPQAIDASDVVYWSCDDGQQATTPGGTFVASWQNQYSGQIVLAPGGVAYDVPAAYFAAMQLYQIK